MPLAVFDIAAVRQNGYGSGQIIRTPVGQVAVTIYTGMVVNGVIEVAVLPGVDGNSDGVRSILFLFQTDPAWFI